MAVKRMRNDGIVKAMIDAKASGKETHFRIYEDGCWWVDIERHTYGMIRFWVGYEDKVTGNSNGSLCTIYDHKDPVDCAADFKLKKIVKDKVLSTYNALHKYSLM